MDAGILGVMSITLLSGSLNPTYPYRADLFIRGVNIVTVEQPEVSVWDGSVVCGVYCLDVCQFEPGKRVCFGLVRGAELNVSGINAWMW